MIAKAIVDGRTTAVVVGVDLLRWYFGVAYESPQEDVRMIVFRIGPLFLHAINRTLP